MTPSATAPTSVSALPEVSIRQLGAQQIWTPNLPLFDWPLDITPRTRIASMGSCFAREIGGWLETHGYTYLREGEGPGVQHGSAPWGRVYNTGCIRQEFERLVHDTFRPAEQVWRMPDGRLKDPYRKEVVWADAEERNAELKAYKAAGRKVLEACEVFILTLGLSEIWYNYTDDAVYFQVPPASVYVASQHMFMLQGARRVALDLEYAIDDLQQINPSCKIVLTLSPVPLRATFRKDTHVMTANMASKSILRAGIEEVVAENVSYFPAYEIITMMGREAYQPDGRHVKPAVVDAIMRLFVRANPRQQQQTLPETEAWRHGTL